MFLWRHLPCVPKQPPSETNQHLRIWLQMGLSEVRGAPTGAALFFPPKHIQNEYPQKRHTQMSVYTFRRGPSLFSVRPRLFWVASCWPAYTRGSRLKVFRTLNFAEMGVEITLLRGFPKHSTAPKLGSGRSSFRTQSRAGVTLPTHNASSVYFNLQNQNRLCQPFWDIFGVPSRESTTHIICFCCFAGGLRAASAIWRGDPCPYCLAV